MKKSFLLFSLMAVGTLLSGCLDQLTGKKESTELSKEVKIGISHCCSRDEAFTYIYLDLIKAALDENEKVSYEAKEALSDEEQQREDIKALLDDGAQALIVSYVDTGSDPESYQKELIDMAKAKDVPIIFYIKGLKSNNLDSYDKAYMVSTSAEESGIIQAEQVHDAWIANPEWDLNSDGIIQYVVLKGTEGSTDAEARTKWVDSTLNSYPGSELKTERLEVGVANWSPVPAEKFMTQWLKKYKDPKTKGVELVISNNDAMAMGALKALDAAGVSLPIFGQNALPEALQLIKDGKVAGTVSQDLGGQAKQTAVLAINLAADRPVHIGAPVRPSGSHANIPNIGITKENVSEFIK